MARRKTYEMVLPKELEDPEAIRGWAGRYSVFEQSKDEWLKSILLPAFNEREFIGIDELNCLDVWKNGSNRLHKHFDINGLEATREKTHAAFKHCRIEPVLKLRGLQLPMASSLMHFICPEEFPIIDRKALWTLTREEIHPRRDMNLWRDYLTECLRIKETYGVDFRTVDRALWQYAKETPWWKRGAKREKPYPLPDRAL